MRRANLADEFVGRIHGRVDVAPQSALRIIQRGGNITKRGAADNEEVKITRSLQRSPGARAIDERELDCAGQWKQRLANDFNRTRRLDEHLL